MGRAARNLLGMYPHGGGASLALEIRTRLYGDPGYEAFEDVHEVGDYIYAAGYTTEGPGSVCGLIVKFNKSDLSIAAAKYYGGASLDYFYGVFADDDFVYCVGRTQSEGPGNTTCLIVKFNASDLSIAARKYYGGTSADQFWDVVASGDYVYAVGQTHSEGWAPAGNYSPLIVKFNKSDLSIAARKYYGGDAIGQSAFRSVFVDGSYVYCAGVTSEPGGGDNYALLVKFNIADLSKSAAKRLGLAAFGFFFNGVFVDGSYVYAVGYEKGSYPLIVQFNLADLTISVSKASSVILTTLFNAVFVEGSYAYAVGWTTTEGEGSQDCLIVKFDVSDMSVAFKKIYGGAAADYWYGVAVQGTYIYAAGYTTSEGEGNYDAMVTRITKSDVPNGNSVPVGFVSDDSGRSFTATSGSLADDGLAVHNSGLTLGNSTLTLGDSALTLSSPYVTTG